nr:polymeric immunoglobulin receptor-like [Paramormyrops kingsleyae]
MSSCTPIVRTDSPKISGEVSIRDDPDQRVFTVTINNVKTVDSGDYWCGVEISRGGMTGRQVYLSVIYGVSTLNTVTVQSGGSVTIPCFYTNIYEEHEKYWCRGSDWSSCSPKVHPNSPKISGEVSIRDDPDQQLFTVTMNNLTAGDSGYYWCGVEISGGSAVGTRVSLSVTEDTAMNDGPLLAQIWFARGGPHMGQHKARCRHVPGIQAPLRICEEDVSWLFQRQKTRKAPGPIISQDLKWQSNISSILKKELLIQFYSAVIESVLCSSITVWFGAATKQDRNRLQQTVRTAERITGASLTTIQDFKNQEKRRENHH